jgi:hypothetical protein
MKNGAIIPYMPSFGLGELFEMKDFLTEHGTTAFVDRHVSPEKIVVRHDIDHDLEHALWFARWEHDHSINSTYFALHSAWYWQDEAESGFRRLREMQDLGHEVGIHNDAMSVARGDRLIAEKTLRDAIDAMSDAGLSIYGAADHGGEFENGKLWDVVNPSFFGLEYEAYQVQRQANVNYISDNRGRLQAPLEYHGARRTVVLIHPEHWVLP